MQSNTNNIYFEMDFSPGEDPDLPTLLSESEADARFLSPPPCRAISQEHFNLVEGFIYKFSLFLQRNNLQRKIRNKF